MQKLLGIDRYPPIAVDERWRASDEEEEMIATAEWEAYIRNIKLEKMAEREKAFREARRNERAAKQIK